MGWLPALLIWTALVGVGAYYTREWWRVGRDPKSGTVVPLFGPPEGLSPMALFFIHRRGTAESISINTGALGSLAELLRRGLVRIDGARIARTEGDTTGIQPDLQRFVDRLVDWGRDVGVEEFAKAAHAHWVDVHGMLAKRILASNLRTTLTGAAILIVSALATVLLVNWTMQAGNDGAMIGAGFVASMLVFAALALRRSRIRSQRLFALGLAAAGVVIVLIVIVLIVVALDDPAGIARAIVLAGLFLVLPMISFAWGVMMALTPEGRRLFDQVEGFRMFIAVADGGRHAIANAPDPTQDSLDKLVPYAIALHVGAGWVNGLAESLPLKQFRPTTV